MKRKSGYLQTEPVENAGSPRSSKKRRAKGDSPSEGYAATESITPDFQLLFNKSPALFLVLMPDVPIFTILGASDAYLSATSRSRDELVGKGIFEAFPDNPNDPSATGTSNVRASILRAIETKLPDSMAVQKYDIPVAEENGGGFESKYWSPIHSPVIAEDGSIAYVVQRVEDVTEFMRLKEQEQELEFRAQRMETEVFARAQEVQQTNEKLRQANLRLSQLDEAKTEFFSNVSHEFRTPLTLLIGPLEDAIRGLDSLPAEALFSLLELAQRNAYRLMRLVNTLLEFSRVEAGRAKARYTPINLPRLTADLSGLFRSAAERAGLKLHVNCPAISEPVFVDVEMWEKIVLNLVSNAFKHTFTGSIEVSTKQVGDQFHLVIADTGVGIPEEEVERVFDRFHQVSSSRSRGQQGSGIGLALVKSLCELHGGRIDLVSKVGEGTKVTVAFPIGKDHLPADQISLLTEDVRDSLGDHIEEEVERLMSTIQSEDLAKLEPSQAETPELSTALLLLVDDNDDLRNYIERILVDAGMGWRVVTAKDGIEALIAASISPPDLVLSDIMMPNLDGIGLTRRLRESQDLSRVPIILLSARAGEEAKVDGLEHGADDYLVKPFSAQELIARVKSHLFLSRARESLLADLREKNKALERAYFELDSFSYSVAHDLRAPLRAINGFGVILAEEYSDRLGPEGVATINSITRATLRMGKLIDHLLMLSRISRSDLDMSEVNLSLLARDVITALQAAHSDSNVSVYIEPGIEAYADARLVQIALENLLGNAWKFSSKQAQPRIEFTSVQDGKRKAFVVRDNGAGFDMKFSANLFKPFERLHSASEFEGTGIGLATVERIIKRHGGEISGQSAPGAGAVFTFTLEP
jgi:signal transduction histidine kinase